jgi:hypothetical protein
MSVMMARPRIKPEHVADVESAAQTMFAALHEAQPDGVRYASCKLADGETFVVMLAVEEGKENPLPAIPEFRAFQEGLKSWIAEPAQPEWLTVVGSYRLL